MVMISASVGHHFSSRDHDLSAVFTMSGGNVDNSSSKRSAISFRSIPSLWRLVVTDRQVAISPAIWAEVDGAKAVSRNIATCLASSGG